MDREILSTEGIYDLLNNKQFYSINVEECVDSTNNVVKMLAEEGKGEGSVLIAREQTNGKGRLGRSFFSPKGEGIYMSVLLRPEKSPDKALVITSAAALAVCKAIREMAGLNASIKWVNDILINDKKVCGILTESKIIMENVDEDTYMQKPEYVVLGIGINISEPKGGYPEDIKDIATSLEDSREKNLANKLVAKILDNFYFYYYDIDLQEDVIRYEYIGCCSTIGKEVKVIGCRDKDSNEIDNSENVICGKAIGIADDMSLIVRNGESVQKINYGEISIRT